MCPASCVPDKIFMLFVSGYVARRYLISCTGMKRFSFFLYFLSCRTLFTSAQIQSRRTCIIEAELSCNVSSGHNPCQDLWKGILRLNALLLSHVHTHRLNTCMWCNLPFYVHLSSTHHRLVPDSLNFIIILTYLYNFDARTHARRVHYEFQATAKKSEWKLR